MSPKRMQERLLIKSFGNSEFVDFIFSYSLRGLMVMAPA